jgi:hypothetical protein
MIWFLKNAHDKGYRDGKDFGYVCGHADGYNEGYMKGMFAGAQAERTNLASQLKVTDIKNGGVMQVIERVVPMEEDPELFAVATPAPNFPEKSFGYEDWQAMKQQDAAEED